MHLGQSACRLAAGQLIERRLEAAIKFPGAAAVGNALYLTRLKLTQLDAQYMRMLLLYCRAMLRDSMIITLNTSFCLRRLRIGSPQATAVCLHVANQLSRIKVIL